MEEEGILPEEDKAPLNVGFTCMVGVTGPMDPEKYPALKDDFAHFKSVIGGIRHSVSILELSHTVPYACTFTGMH